MHATFRRISVTPGSAEEVGRLIEQEYLPLIADVPGFHTYTLVALGDDEVTSIGVFDSAESAAEANERARTWVAERLAPFVASPLEARDGAVLVSHRAG